MMKYFDIFFEFDRRVVNENINKYITLGKKGYVCVVDGNVLATSFKNSDYKKIINNSFVNLCDGSSIALLASKIHKKKFSTYTGPEIFAEYVPKNFKQYFLGNTEEKLNRLNEIFTDIDYNVNLFRFESLPFKNVEDFDYKTIAENINEFSPDIIWVSLGAPKQEIFISKLYPHVNRGVLFAIGAAFNLYLGEKENKRAPKIIREMHLEWIFRVIQEPKRIGKRALNYLCILPRLIFDEIKCKNNLKQLL